MRKRNNLRVAIAACLLVALTTVQAKNPEEVTAHSFLKTSVSSDLITLLPMQDFAGFDLKVTGPDGFYYQESFSGSEMPFIELFDPDGHVLVDGHYTYEVVARPYVSEETRQAMAAARESGQASEVLAMRKTGELPREGFRQAGTFRVQDGLIALPSVVESMGFGPIERSSEGRDDGSRPGTPTDGGDDGGTVDSGSHDFDTERRDQVINDDLIVTQSLCVGIDCSNGESFGFDTIRLKENNLRIRFFDTSTTASFPSNDWQLTANDSDNGGANKFSIDDIDGGRTPFTIEASAPSHSLYVDDGGRIGLGTMTPVVELHIKNGDSPTLRLEQDGSSGFTPQTWDVAGNETNFFVRDVTNGSRLPFKIKPTAPTNSLFIDTDGSIGVGTQSPTANLDMVDTVNPMQMTIRGNDPSIIVERSDAATSDSPIQMDLINNGQVNLRYNNNEGGINRRWNTGVDDDNRYFVSASGTGAFEFLLQTNGNLTLTGTVTAPSDVNMKHDFEPVSPEEVLEKVVAMPLTTWSYKHDQTGERHMGPMAQDFHAAFGLGQDERHISFTDTAGVALGAIQGLNQMMAQMKAELEAKFEAKLKAQEARIKELEAQLKQ